LPIFGLVEVGMARKVFGIMSLEIEGARAFETNNLFSTRIFYYGYYSIY